ncbi:predicted protein [Histoplasma capsulatum G186AR]|uniref:Uncharacterized protein n=1 Tax=Ajellomyces capsulatus (strain G186AR / H82 / ATCC MYA-2454 / RMSCC 2432) TaxID=447093 RepID=C0NGK0_AJECG|nr:uncharacterized protein HCBG_02472 [Histoplasma capsulatum G186AR]EEH08935.1 predicted protein [Histoplasma capsulatum G186AR]
MWKLPYLPVKFDPTELIGSLKPMAPLEEVVYLHFLCEVWRHQSARGPAPWPRRSGKGGRSNCDDEAFDGAVLGYKMENIDYGTELANGEHIRIARGGDGAIMARMIVRVKGVK